jgi:hypothetical protein
MPSSERQVAGHRRRGEATTRRGWSMWAAAALAVAAACGCADRADAAIYWTYNSVSPKGGHEVRAHIGRADLNGKHANPRFITLKRKLIATGVAASRRHIYWTTISAPAVGIGRAKLDGSGVDQGFTPVLPLDEGRFSAAHSEITVAGGHLYWANIGYSSIGRSDLDGSNVNEDFIPASLGSSPVAVAVGGGYVFWADQSANTIGRANLDGSDPRPAFIVGAHVPDAIAVAGGYVYWGNIPSPAEDTVGRAKINGTKVNQRFLRHTTALALAAKGRYIYGSDFNYIWRARLDGSHLKRHFIKTTGGPEGLAVR